MNTFQASALALCIPLASANAFSLFEGVQYTDLEYEGLYSNDIDVQRASILYSQDRGDWDFELRLGYVDYELEYEPFAFLGGTPTTIDEDTREISFTVGRTISDTVDTSLSFSAYDGFSDYRSIWIAEYYRQTFSPFPASGYVDPDPEGFSISSGWVWTPKLGTIFSFDLAYSEDTIAPGWDFGAPANDLLKTRAFSVRWEQAVNPKVKTETSFSLSDITDRDPRINLQSSWNVALAKDLTLGLQAGASKEQPSFESIYAGLTLTHNITSHWSITGSARFYDDSGEIESSGFNSSAPGVQSGELGLSALYTKGSHSLRLGISRLYTDYDPVDSDNEFFTHLYQDRNWWTSRIAYTYNF